MAVVSTKYAKLKLRGATVVEVIVALIIIMLVFGLATMTYVRIVNSSSNPKLRLRQQLTVLGSEASNGSMDPSDRSYILESDIQVEQKVSPYEGSEQLLLLELEAFDKQEKPLASYRKIIQKKSNETH